MKDACQLREVRAHYGELVEAALQKGPQRVIRRGEQAVVVLAHSEYVRLTRPDTTLYEALRGAPGELTFERDRTPVPAVTME